MRYSKPLLIVLLLALLCDTAVLNPARGSQGFADRPSGKVRSGVFLEASSEAGVVFEVRLSVQEIGLERVSVEEKPYTLVSVPGWAETSQAGAPVLPYQVVEIGAPIGASVSVQVRPGRARKLELGVEVLPTVRQEVQWDPNLGSQSRPTVSYTVSEGRAVYTASRLYPGKLAEVVGDGVLRQQRVVSIASYPIQVNPLAGELIVYESLRVEVRFTGPAAASRIALRPEAQAIDQLLKASLLNGVEAAQWRQSDVHGEARSEPITGAVRQPMTLIPDPSPYAVGRESGLISPFILNREKRVGGLRVEASAWTPPEPGWRVSIREDGFYRLTYAELQAAGLPVDQLDPHTFQLYSRGVEAAIEVSGEEDGRFDPADAVIYYGQAVKSKYTADNVYWLTYGQAPGLRMNSRDGRPGSAPELATTTTHRRLEENHYYVPGMPGDDRLERWAWNYLSSLSRTRWQTTFFLTDPSPGPAKLTLALLGYSEAEVDPDHHLTVNLNGEQVGDVRWDGKAWQAAEIDLPAGLLAAGANTLDLQCPKDTGAGYDLAYIDWANLEFHSSLTAHADLLAFTNEEGGAWRYRIAGFDDARVSLYDVSDPLAPVRIENVSVIPTVLQYSAQFQDETNALAGYWALSETAFLTAQSIEKDTPSDLTGPENGADYILISPRDFMTAGAVLRDFRLSQGLRARLVDVQDVYDQFGYGIVEPEAIHDFLAYAYTHWQAPAPAYVVLVGDGHYDPKDYTGYGRASNIPPFLAMADPWIGETAADNRYVTLAGEDSLADMMLGRLSVNSAQEAIAMIEKIIAYEQSPAPEDWQQQILAVADRPDGLLDFPRQSDDLIDCCLPEPYQATRVYYGKTYLELQEARETIQAEIASGKLLVNFAGHASATRWSADGLLETDDIPLLQNQGKLPVVLAMTCWDGYYQYPNPEAMGWEAMGEVITRQPGAGAVASWSPTGIGLVSGHRSLSEGFYRAVFQEGLSGLGEATTAGKLSLWATGENLDLLNTFLLFGDPAMRIKTMPAELPNWRIFLPYIHLNREASPARLDWLLDW